MLTETKLAIHGGPMEIPEGPPPWPETDQAIIHAVNQALADGSWSKYDGPWTERLGIRLCEIFGCHHVLLCSSGTIAVELALRGAGVLAGTEVIMSGYDFPGNFRAVEAIGAHPVLVDVVPVGWVMDVEQIQRAITEKTSAIIVSHLHGQVADLPRIMEIAAERGKIAVVEDACQMPGATVAGRAVGTLANIAALSFGGNKLLSAGRGGAVITNRADDYQRAKIFNNRGNDAFPLSQLQAAALLPQLDRLGERTKMRHAGAKRLIEQTSGIPILSGLKQLVSGDALLPAYYKLPWILSNNPRGGWTRSDFVAAMQAEGVPLDTSFRGFTRRSPRRCRRIGTLVNSQIAAQQSVLLHHSVLLQSNDAIDRVAGAIRKVAAGG